MIKPVLQMRNLRLRGNRVTRIRPHSPVSDNADPPQAPHPKPAQMAPSRLHMPGLFPPALPASPSHCAKVRPAFLPFWGAEITPHAFSVPPCLSQLSAQVHHSASQTAAPLCPQDKVPSRPLSAGLCPLLHPHCSATPAWPSQDPSRAQSPGGHGTRMRRLMHAKYLGGSLVCGWCSANPPANPQL